VSLKGNRRPSSRASGAAVAALVCAALILSACHRQTPQAVVDEKAGFEVNNAGDCLPDITLTDQHGQKVTLASLRGKPILFDFIYTSCPGPCLVLTSRMKAIANDLGSALGTKVRLVSITVDPEHDHAEQLQTYASAHAADVNGWSFLTGSPQQIDEVMSHFNLIRQRESDGTVDHVLEFFLVGPDGRALLEYMGEKADPARVADDVTDAASGKPVTAGDGTVVAEKF